MQMKFHFAFGFQITEQNTTVDLPPSPCPLADPVSMHVLHGLTDSLSAMRVRAEEQLQLDAALQELQLPEDDEVGYVAASNSQMPRTCSTLHDCAYYFCGLQLLFLLRSYVKASCTLCALRR
jgi:hypothetical protein